MRLTTTLFILVALHTFSVRAESDCIIIKHRDYTNSTSKFEITKPGNYCLIENLNSRLDFADHSAEPRLIQIWSSDVVLDLQNHTLGRGKFFRSPGGVGIEINENFYNITIKNGTLQDFEAGIYRGVSTLSDGKKKILKPVYDPVTRTYRFDRDNIVIKNVRFINDKIDMQIEEKE